MFIKTLFVLLKWDAPLSEMQFCEWQIREFRDQSCLSSIRFREQLMSIFKLQEIPKFSHRERKSICGVV